MSNTVSAPSPAWGDPTLSDAEKRALAALCARIVDDLHAAADLVRRSLGAA